MKHIIAILILGIVLQVRGFSQGIVDFNVNLGDNPPPHIPGVPDSGAVLTNDSFYVAIYLGGTAPVSGFILEKSGEGSFTPIFQSTNLVFAGYPPPATGVAYDYEGSWQLTNPKIQNLLAGMWYAQINYVDTSYMGQLASVPEPSNIAFLTGGFIVFWRYIRQRHGAIRIC